MAIETVHVREKSVSGLTARDLEETSFYELLQDRYGIVVVGGTQTIEPTVTDEEESAALGRPAAFARLSLRARHALGDGRDRRVRGVDLPRRPLPARHVPLGSAGTTQDESAVVGRGRRARRSAGDEAWLVPHLITGATAVAGENFRFYAAIRRVSTMKRGLDSGGGMWKPAV